MRGFKTFEHFVETFKPSGTVNRIMITGASGRLGNELYQGLKRIYPPENILCVDLKNDRNIPDEYFSQLNVLDSQKFDEMVVNWRPDTILHLATVLSGKGEHNPDLCLTINTKGTQNAFDIATKHKIKLFYASSISTFGRDTPKKNVSDLTVQRPNSISGITSAYMELLGEWYNLKQGTDFRCLRYPSIISPSKVNYGTAMCIVDIYYQALMKKRYTNYLAPDQLMSVIYIDDLLSGTIRFLEAPPSKLQRRIYNIQSCSLTPRDQAESIAYRIPEFKVDYQIDDRNRIVDTWPDTIDDSSARMQWGYKPYYDLAKITDKMLFEVRNKVWFL